MKKGHAQRRMLLSVIAILFVLSGCGLEGDPSLHQLVGGGSVNTPPTADAGKDQHIEVGKTITITGTGTDSDGSIISYEWGKGTEVLATVASFSYVPTVVGTDTLVLTVTDDDGATASDEMQVTVTGVNTAPVAIITKPSADATYLCYEGPSPSIVLDGSESFDKDGDALTYVWSGTAGTNTASIHSLINDRSNKITSITRDDLCNFVDNNDNGVTCSSTGYGSRLTKTWYTESVNNDAIYDPGTDGSCTVTIDLNVSDGSTSGSDSAKVNIRIQFPT